MRNATTDATLDTSPAVALSAGDRYIGDYLPNLDRISDAGWLAEAIDAGSLVVCDRCHFLSLPTPAFPWGVQLTSRAPVPQGCCEVCAHLPSALEFGFSYENIGRALAGAADALVEAREKRAELFFDLFMSGCDCADALVWGEMGKALAPLRRKDSEAQAAAEAPSATETFDTRRPALEIAA